MTDKSQINLLGAVNPLAIPAKAEAEVGVREALKRELAEWFNALDFDRSADATRHAEYSALMEILAAESAPIEQKALALEKQVRSILDHLNGQAYSSTLSAANDLRAALANLPAKTERAAVVEDDDSETCVACSIAFKEGDDVLDDADGGFIHASCCGPERDSYFGADGGPLKDGEPLPISWKWSALVPPLTGIKS